MRERIYHELSLLNPTSTPPHFHKIPIYLRILCTPTIVKCILTVLSTTDPHPTPLPPHPHPHTINPHAPHPHPHTLPPHPHPSPHTLTITPTPSPLTPTPTPYLHTLTPHPTPSPSPPHPHPHQMEKMIRLMQHDTSGIAIRCQKSFLSTLPAVFTG